MHLFALKRNFIVFYLQLISPAYCLGIESMILTSLNYAAPEVHAIIENIEAGNVPEARRIQNRIRNLTEYIIAESKNCFIKSNFRTATF